jgi:protease-4
MKKVVIGVLAAAGALAMMAVLCAIGVTAVVLLAREPVPASTILELDFERGVVEHVPGDPLAEFMLEGPLQLVDVVDAIDRAAADRRVKALFARIGGGGMGLAHIQEIRDAVTRFQDSGKPATAFAETFGEFGPGNGGYYLASAFGEVYLQPSGDVGLTGLMYESPFIVGLLEKLGVTPRMSQRHEYKNAMNFYTDRALNEPHRRSLQALMDSQFRQLVRGIAGSRGLSEERVVELFDQGPFLGAEAVACGLVDGLAYRDEVIARVREGVGARSRLLDGADYLERAGRPHRRGKTIALIHGHGAVTRGRSTYSLLDGSVTMGSDSLAAAFRAAVRDPRVKAIIFRVDSPGGSYVASDTILRETVRAREAGKPVIVSMGNLAGSGGYFVALDADKIVAQPGTITASIGVTGGKLLTRELWSKVGVTWDDVHTSDHSTMWASTYDFGESAERFHATLDRVYQDFTEKVAAGRSLPLERVLEIARGRIWTGEDALDLGLVDELGGLERALSLAREAAGLPDDAPVRLAPYPPRLSVWDYVFGRPDSGEDVLASALTRALADLQPLVRAWGRLGLRESPGPLTVPF